MSIITERFPMCDRCQEACPDYRSRGQAASQLRVDMERDGWIRIDGKDICPICVERDAQ